MTEYSAGKTFRITQTIVENNQLFANIGDEVVIVEPPCEGTSLCIRVQHKTTGEKFCVSRNEIEEL